ncbi:MAG: respiratory nitrate reductase subunit gamma [Actinomycetaceae bacterium]|nr:respiratory nitrate reductase subunit gamma [Actinomycetaceae bacterium]
MNALSLFLWVGVPYLSLAIMVVGLIWRYKSDQYGWTSKSSQLQESFILRAASPLFHFGIIFVGLGHLMGLAVPDSWTSAVGVSAHAYHLVATIGGSIAALMTLVGMFGLLYRRFVTKAVRFANTKRDVVAWVFLAIPILLGTWATLRQQIFGASGGYDYRQTISPWLRSLFYFQPQPELMQAVPIEFKLHILAAFLLFAIWPFTRLVHVFSAPVLYPTRPYIVYRARDQRTKPANRRNIGRSGSWPQ